MSTAIFAFHCTVLPAALFAASYWRWMRQCTGLCSRCSRLGNSTPTTATAVTGSPSTVAMRATDLDDGGVSGGGGGGGGGSGGGSIGVGTPNSSAGVASLVDDIASVVASSTRTGSCPSVSSSWGALPQALPRILIVSRRHMRKDKFVDFVGEYHLTLILRYGACPVIVPRCVGADTTGEEVSRLIDAYEPIHGVLLCEGEDIDLKAWPGALGPDGGGMTDEQTATVAASHPSDASVDQAKDLIEFELVRRCVARGIPYLGICRGSQVLNVYRGGTLYSDIDTQVGGGVTHIDYNNYDSHRHPVSVTPTTPLADWFDGATALDVNSYHHQGVRTLAQGFTPMAHSPDGLVEAFYEPAAYDPDAGRYCIGLQFHPERMQDRSTGVYDYPGCVGAYEAFGRAVRAYARRATPERVEAPLEQVPAPVSLGAPSPPMPACSDGCDGGLASPRTNLSAAASPVHCAARTCPPAPIQLPAATLVSLGPSPGIGRARSASASPSSRRGTDSDIPPRAITAGRLGPRVSRAHSDAVSSFAVASQMYRTRRASESLHAASLSRGASLLASTSSAPRSLYATVHGGCAVRDALGLCNGGAAESPSVVEPMAQLEAAVVAAAAALARMGHAELSEASETLRGLVGVAARLQERGEALEKGGGCPRGVGTGLQEEEDETCPRGAPTKGVKA